MKNSSEIIPPLNADTAVKKLQDKVLNMALVAFLFITIITYTITIFRALEFGFNITFVVHSIISVFQITITTFRRQMSVKLKVISVLAICSCVLGFGLYQYGFLGSGKFFIIVLPVFTSFIINYKKSLIVLLSTGSAYLLFGYLHTTGILNVSVNPTAYITNPIVWLMEASIIIITAWALLFTGVHFQKEMLKTIQDQHLHYNRLKISEAKFRGVFENANDGITLLRNGVFFDCNPKACEYFGCSKEELIGRSPNDLSPLLQADGSKSAEKALDVVTKTLKGNPQQFDWQHKRMNGEVFDVNISLNMISFDGDTYVQGTLRDISVSKKLEKRLRESENRLQEILDNTSDAIFIIDPNTGIVVDVNRTMLKMYGYTDKEDVAMHGMECFSAESESINLVRAGELMQQTSFTRSTYFEWTAKKKNGQLFWVEVALKRTILHGKEHILATVHDIDQRKKNELIIREKNATFKNIFTKSADGVLLISKGLFTDCNNAALQQLDMQLPTELIGKSPADISPVLQPDGFASVDKAQKLFQQCLTEGFSRFEWVHLKKNGQEVSLDIMLTLITDDNKETTHCVWRDITEKKQYQSELEEHRNKLEILVVQRTQELETANEELKSINERLYQKSSIINNQNSELQATLDNLKEAQSQLVQSEKMASLGVLTAGVAHEINNPLNYILGAYNGLEKLFKEIDLRDDPKVNFLLSAIKTGVTRTTEIVKGLNHFSRNQDSYDETCDVHSIINNCLTILHNQIKYTIEVERTFAEAMYDIKGNSGKLHQVFLNIFTNAIQAMPDGGTLKVHTHKQADYFLIEISDTGHGIPEEHMHKITDPFFTTKEPGKGTGLGLSITYNIIRDHKGRIEFASEPDSGTQVTVSLPLTLS